MFATDTFLTAYARTADDSDFESLRLVVAGAEAVRAETRRVWRERFGAEIVEGFGMTEASPVVAVNSADAWPRRNGRTPDAGNAHADRAGRRHRRGRQAVGRRPQRHDGLHDGGSPGEIDPAGERLARQRRHGGDRPRGFHPDQGRTKRFAKIAGEMVSLGAVEMLVQSLWPEDHHAVVSVPDKRRGERIVLVTTGGRRSPTHCGSSQQEGGARRTMVPADIVKVGAMPMLGTGKTDYPSARGASPWRCWGLMRRRDFDRRLTSAAATRRLRHRVASPLRPRRA